MKEIDIIGRAKYEIAFEALKRRVGSGLPITIDEYRVLLADTPGVTFPAGATFGDAIDDMERWGWISIKDGYIAPVNA